MAKFKIKEDCFAKGQDGSCSILNTCLCVLTGKCSFYKTRQKAKADAGRAYQKAVARGYYAPGSDKYEPRGGC